MSENPAQEPIYYRPDPLTKEDLNTTIRVLQTIDKFQENMHNLRAFQVNGHDVKFTSALKPATQAVETFRDWWHHLTKAPSESDKR